MDPRINQPINQSRMRIPSNILFLTVLLVAGVCAYLFVMAFKDYQGSGVLIAESPDSKALLSISQTNHQAKFIGKGTAKVRLPAGSYEVASSFKGGHALGIAEVKKGQSSKITLPKNKDSLLPSVLSIDFQNIDSLTNGGLSATQTAVLKQYIFKFKKDANKVVVDGSSIQPGPHNPDTDIGFSTTFMAKIDSSQYKAVVSYIGLDDLRLKLYDTAGTLVFDSGA